MTAVKNLRRFSKQVVARVQLGQNSTANIARKAGTRLTWLVTGGLLLGLLLISVLVFDSGVVNNVGTKYNTNSKPLTGVSIQKGFDKAKEEFFPEEGEAHIEEGPGSANRDQDDGRPSVWKRAPLMPEDINEPGNVMYMKMARKSVPRLDNFIGDIVPNRNKMLMTGAEQNDALKITKGVKIYVAPVNEHTMYCLGVGGHCDNTLGCWDKRLWLFLREAFAYVHPAEADFVFLPYFQYCFFYFEGCYAQVGKRKSTTMDVLSLIYNETVNHLEDLAPGRNWSNRIVVPMSHDFGGCVTFALSKTEKKARIKGQPPILQEAVVVQALGDYDEPCHIVGKDIVIPAFIEYETITAEVKKNSERKYLIYFGGTLRFDLRKPGIRKILATASNYKHLDRSIIGYVKPRSNYSHVIHNTAFCLGPPGVVGWTGRVWESLWAGCIPVFISEYTMYPWEDFLDYSKFTLHYNYSDADRIEELLLAITDDERDRMAEEGQKVRDLFVYTPPFTQEKGPFSYLLKTLRKKKAVLDKEQGPIS